MTAPPRLRVWVPLAALVLGTAALLWQPGCGGDADCKPGTARVHVRLPLANLPAVITSVTVEFETGGVIIATRQVAIPPGASEATVDAEFPGGYPKNARVVVRAYVKSNAPADGVTGGVSDGGAEGGMVVATWFKQVTFSDSCQSLNINFFAVPGLDARPRDTSTAEASVPPDSGDDAFPADTLPADGSHGDAVGDAPDGAVSNDAAPTDAADAAGDADVVDAPGNDS